MRQSKPLGRMAGTALAALMTLAGLGRVEAGPAVAWPTRGWPKGAPADVGLDANKLAEFDADLAAGKYALVDSFQVFRCGKEVFARKYARDYSKIYATEAITKGPLNARLTGPYNYFDPYWHPYFHGTDLHSMQSVSKTVTSVIYGIAMTRGDFKAGLNTPVLKYFDASKVKNVDERKRRMTLKDVLTMTTGLAWNEEDVPYDDPRSDSSLMEATDDWVQYVIDKPMAADPGTVFNYSSGATELLAYIFQKETGQDIDAYGEAHLFAPLGIKHHWKRTYLGVVDTEGGLYLDGADLAKIGYLFLHDGMWDGRRIVSKEWVTQIGDALYRCHRPLQVRIQMVALSAHASRTIHLDGPRLRRPETDGISRGGLDRHLHRLGDRARRRADARPGGPPVAGDRRGEMQRNSP